uniref:protein HAPLESS 2 n=1 Tax=Erigeron canadensis TaxID=72917 RepID=UPI001CB94BD4
LILSYLNLNLILIYTISVQLLSKSKLEKCEKVSGNNKDPLNCTQKIVVDMAVPSEATGGEASITAQIDEVENTTDNMKTLRDPPTITITKSAAYAQYQLTYIRDVAYRPQELFFKTRKCSSSAGANVVQQCESLRDNQGRIIEHTQPTCCPCGKWRRVPSSCGNFFNKVRKGKANTAHCVRFPGDWFHVFGIGQHTVGFSIRIQVKKGTKVSEVVIGPNNRTAASSDNFLRVNLIGDYAGYSDVPSFENFFLAVPRQGNPGQPQDLGRNYSMWMLLERIRFTLDGLECDKIGVSYEAFNRQPNFCSAPFGSCLHNQLWNFWESDQNRINRKQMPLFTVQGKYERINEHPNAGSLSFSIGITEVINSNVLIELSADDIEYVYQRSPGNIVSVTIPTFEALTQYGTATITANNTGEVEASYSLTFDCSGGVSQMEEQFFIMRPNVVASRHFKLYPTNDQAAKYVCFAILKDSDFHEVDRAECQFTTTATVIDNGTQTVFEPPKNEVKGFFDSIEDWWHMLWEGMVDFITGKSCRKKCSGFFDFNCHVHYICMSWMLMFGLFLAIFPTVIVLVWLLHENGLFDPFYDWWEDHFWDDERKIQHLRKHAIHVHHKKKPKHHTDGHHTNQKDDHQEHRHNVKKDKHKHERIKASSIIKHPLYLGAGDDDDDDDNVGERRQRKERGNMELVKFSKHGDRTVNKHGHATSEDKRHKHLHSKRKL